MGAVEYFCRIQNKNYQYLRKKDPYKNASSSCISVWLQNLQKLALQDFDRLKKIVYTLNFFQEKISWNQQKLSHTTLRKKSPYSELLWSVFSAFGLNTERYAVSLGIQSECRKIRTRITPNTDAFYVVLVPSLKQLWNFKT